MRHLAFLLLLLMMGCRREMYDQARGDAYKSSDFFANGAASQPLPAHTVPQENFHSNLWFDTGRIGSNFVTALPLPVTRQLLERGHERFDIYCAMCHGESGDGNGIVPQRGFPHPPNLAIDRLRAQPTGYFVDVITRGYGVMFSYADRVPPEDRWAIAAYIRALQLSQHATLAEIPDLQKSQLESTTR